MNITKFHSKHLFRIISLWFYLDRYFSFSVHSSFSHGHIFLIVRAIDFLGKKWLVATSLFVELFSSPRKFEARTIGSCSLLKWFHPHAVGCSWIYSCLSLKFCPETSFGVWKNFSWNQCIKNKLTAKFLFLTVFTGKLPTGFSYKLPRRLLNVSLQDTTLTGKTRIFL